MTAIIEILTKVLAQIVTALVEAGASEDEIRKAMAKDPTIRTHETDRVLDAIRDAMKAAK